MKFKDIEKIINEEGIILKDYSGNELEKGTLDQILHTVCNKIREILAENKIEGVKLSVYNQRIYLESQKYYSYNGNEPSGIIIKVKKEKVDSHWSYFGTTTYYKFKSIEIEKVERYIDKELKELETIEDYFKYKEKIDNDRKEYIQNKKEQFIDKVDDMEKFFILMREFKSLDYNSRLEIAKYTFGEDYWKYTNI